MTKVTIQSGPFTGSVGEIIERGETSSRVRLTIFGRQTEVEVMNDQFVADGEEFDPFANFEADIATDRRWEAGEQELDWWLDQRGQLTAETWARHLERAAASRDAAAAEASELAARLREEVGADANLETIGLHFKKHEDRFRPYRVAWRARQEELTQADHDQEEARRREVSALQRVAFRMWWAVKPRDAGDCRQFLDAAWSGDDYQAMADAEVEAFDRWGRDAVELVMNRWRTEPLAVRDLDTLPEGHAWRAFVGVEPGTAVRQSFAAIADHAPRFVDAFSHAVRAIYWVELNSEPWLVYACDSEEGYGRNTRPVLSIVVGAPALQTASDDRLHHYVRETRWTVPEPLRTLYAVHHGLGRLASWATTFDNAGSIYPTEQLSVLGDIMNSIAEEQNFVPGGYAFDNLLTFFEDGAGNGQNFFRHAPDQPPTGTVDWDHETREVSGVQTFWAFLEESPMRWWFGENLP